LEVKFLIYGYGDVVVRRMEPAHLPSSSGN